jgi:hypothetical protein
MGRMPTQGICQVCLLGFFLLYASSCRSSKEKVNHLEEANSLTQAGETALGEGRYDDAVRSFQNALTHTQKIKDGSMLSDSLSSKIRQAKAKSLIYHFQSNSNDQEDSDREALLPPTLESQEFLVLQSFGNVSAQRIWAKRMIYGEDDFVGKGRKITVLPNSGIELSLNPTYDLTVRSVGSSGFVLPETNLCEFYSGAFLISGKRLSPRVWSFVCPLGQVWVESGTSFAFTLEITTNGGCKLITLAGEPVFYLENRTRLALEPGELVFVMQNEFSQKMNIELSTYIATTPLVADFEEPPMLSRKMRQQALIQALRTKRHYRALVGDAKTMDDFEVNILDEQDVEKTIQD